jgi:hypothetical protein
MFSSKPDGRLEHFDAKGFLGRRTAVGNSEVGHDERKSPSKKPSLDTWAVPNNDHVELESYPPTE